MSLKGIEFTQEELQHYQLKIVGDQQDFQTKLTNLLIINPNARSVSGLSLIAHCAQSRLYSISHLDEDKLAGSIGRSHSEFGARIPATILDRDTVGVEYEVGNLEAWLRTKGIKVNYNGPYHVPWGKTTWHIQGHKEETYFNKEGLSIGATLVMFDHIAAEAAAFARFCTDKLAKDFFQLSAEVSKVVGLEIRSLVFTGKLPSQDLYISVLRNPLAQLGIDLEV